MSGEVTFNPRGLTATAAQPRFASDPPYATSFTYDPRNRVTRQEYADCNPACSAETFLYGLNYSVHTNPDGEYTVTSRDATGLTTYFVEYLSGNPIYTTTIQVPQNHATAVYDNQANMWYTQTDSLGRPIAILDPDSSWETREYYDSNELEATVNMLGERTEFTYDGIGRMLTKTTRAGTPNAQLTNFIYDVFDPSYSNIGTLSRMDDSEGFEVYDYDALGRPKRKRRNLDAQDYTFVFSYNAAGLPSSTLYPDAQTISWTYDAAGNLETETGTITASSYDAAGRLKTRDFTNGIVSTMSYDPARGWIDSIDATDGVSPPVQDLTYEHNRDGTIQSVTSAKPMESWTYTYDDLNRLKTATNVDTPSTLSQTFDYDDIGNITYNDHIGTYTYPAATNPQPHAVATAGSRTYGYNAIGQMTNRNGTIIQWNGDGKPSSIGSVVFAYDGVGGRLKKTSSGQTTRWIGGDYEIAHSGTVTKYLAGGKQVGSDFFVHHRDHLGSIQGVTDATGTEVRRQDHKPFGDQHFVSGSHQESKGWIGEREEETELVYLNARYYDPEIGRFISADPVLTPGQGMNRYTYSLSNPVNFRDPSGMNCGCGPHGDPNGGRHRERQQARMERAQQNREATNFYRISDNREINLAYRRLWDRALNNEELPAEQRGALVTSLLALRGDGVSITFSADGLENWELGVTTYMGTTQLADETHTCSLSVGCAKVSIHIRPGLAGDELAMVLAHEGDHVAKFDAYAADVINKRGADGGENDVTLADMERSAYGVTAAAANALGVETVTVTGRTGREFTIFNNGTIDSTAIDSLVEDLGLDDWTISESIIGRHHPFLPWGT